MRKLIFYPLYFLFRLISNSVKLKLINKILYSSIIAKKPDEKLKLLFEIENFLYGLIKESALEYGNGIHPKHGIMNYHEFFIKNIKTNSRVLDIGSGNGFLAYDIVSNIQGVNLLGIELNEKNVKIADENFIHENLIFKQGDALKDLPDEKFDVIILSNVLEHIDNRKGFLKTVVKKCKPDYLLIRVPLFERDWTVGLKKELLIDYRLDLTHYIEYTKEGFVEEMIQSGLEVESAEFKWGEIWAKIVPINSVNDE